MSKEQHAYGTVVTWYGMIRIAYTEEQYQEAQEQEARKSEMALEGATLCLFASLAYILLVIVKACSL